MHGNAQPPARFGDRARARGRPADGQVVAQLDAIGTAGLGRDGRLDVAHADLDRHPPVRHRGPPDSSIDDGT